MGRRTALRPAPASVWRPGIIRSPRAVSIPRRLLQLAYPGGPGNGATPARTRPDRYHSQTGPHLFTSLARRRRNPHLPAPPANSTGLFPWRTTRVGGDPRHKPHISKEIPDPVIE